MKNQKYYCAWHPEEPLSSFMVSTNVDLVKAQVIKFNHGFSNHNKTQGWQVKEVVIVDADEFDKLTKEQPEKHFIAGWQACESNAEFDGVSMSAHLDQYLQTVNKGATDDKE